MKMGMRRPCTHMVAAVLLALGAAGCGDEGATADIDAAGDTIHGDKDAHQDGGGGDVTGDPDVGHDADDDAGQDASADAAGPDAEQDGSGPDAVEDVVESDAVEDVSGPDAVEDASVPDAVEDVSVPDAVEDASEPDAVEDASEPDAVEDVSGPDAVEDVSVPDAVEDVSMPDAVEDVSGPDAVEPDVAEDAADADVTPPVCSPGETDCGEDGASVWVCAGDGSGFEPAETCPITHACQLVAEAAVCVDVSVCSPGALSCAADGEGIEQCRADGSGVDPVEACPLTHACQTVAGTPTCVDVSVCDPGALSCSDDAKGVLVCVEDGSGSAPSATCPVGQICQASDGTAACVPDPSLVCVPNSKLCSEDAKYVLQCNATGTATQNFQLCATNKICMADGTTASCVDDPALLCTKNERTCSADLKQVLQCKTTGIGTFVYATCASGKICQEADGTASCVDDVGIVCNAGKTYCAPDLGEVRVCAADGKSWTVAEACTGGAQCTTNNVDFWCACTPKVGKACEDGDVVWVDSCGATTLDVACNPGAPCDDSGATPVCGACTPATSTKCGTTAEGGAAVVTVNSCGVVDGVAEACAEGLVCYDYGDGATCTSSVGDPDSPYYADSCVFEQFVSEPTALDADCRCLTNRALTGGLPVCWRPYEAYISESGVTVGAGVRVGAHPQATLLGGFLDAAQGKIVAAVAWSSAANPDAGFVMAFDLATGDRTVLSGEHLSAGGAPAEVGAGHRLTNVIDVQRGPDGTLYVWSGTNVMGEIVAVDPATGDRTLVWQRDGAGFAVCDNGRDGKSVQTRADGFAIDAAGAFYLGFSNTSPVGEGLGVIRISGTGAQQTCQYVTRAGTMAGNAMAGTSVGAGWAFTSGVLTGFGLHDGKLLALNAFDLTLYAIDLATGDRARLTGASTANPLGSGPTGSSGVGHRWVKWDAARARYWTVGRQGGTQVVLVDPATAARVALSCNDAPADPGLACISGSLDSGLSQNYGGFWFAPDDADRVYFSHDGMGLVVLEVSTGNSMIFSL